MITAIPTTTRNRAFIHLRDPLILDVQQPPPSEDEPLSQPVDESVTGGVIGDDPHPHDDFAVDGPQQELLFIVSFMIYFPPESHL